MTSLWIILFYLGAIIFVVLIFTTLYQIYMTLYWMWKNKYNGSNTEYESKQLKKYKRLILRNLPFIIIIGLGIFTFYLPVNFEEVSGNEEILKRVDKVILITYEEDFIDHNITNKNEINEILNILQDYEYRKDISESRFLTIGMVNGGEALDIIMCNEEKFYIPTIQITNTGYIYNAYTGQAYRAISDDKAEIYTRLIEVLRSKK